MRPGAEGLLNTSSPQLIHLVANLMTLPSCAQLAQTSPSLLRCSLKRRSKVSAARSGFCVTSASAKRKNTERPNGHSVFLAGAEGLLNTSSPQRIHLVANLMTLPSCEQLAQTSPSLLRCSRKFALLCQCRSEWVLRHLCLCQKKKHGTPEWTFRVFGRGRRT